MFGGLGGALKGLSSKAEEMIEKTKTSVGEMAAEKKAAASALLESQVKKTGDVLWQSKNNLEATGTEALTETKQAALEGFDKEVEKVEKTVEEGVTENKSEGKAAEATTPEGNKAEESSGFDPTKLISEGLGSLDIAGQVSGGLATVDKEVEKVVDNTLNEVSHTIDSKIKEADEFIDEKRENVVHKIQEETSKAASSTEGFGAVLGKAKGLLN